MRDVDAAYMGGALVKTLWEARQYGAMPLKPGQTMPTDTPLMLAVGAGYAVILVVAAFVVYRRRDL